ncbi:unnamed protein product [Diabrotica balteata]|uniref:MGA conserved domain-containing protein n=1 Tax=Diabrotica balteata TaxID=107213 RepID=A0A9N9T3N0_DIABA|nr:unnamed protein product [Diabrotica balteata]
MDQDEVIKQLLSKTGWTCDDLIQRLNTFKSATVIAENQVLSPQFCNATETASTSSSMLKHDKDHIGTEDVSELHSFTKEIQSLNSDDNIEFLNKKDAGNEEAQVADSPKLNIATIEVNKGCQVVAKNGETDSIKRHEDNKTIKNLGNTVCLPHTSSLETNYVSKGNDFAAGFKSSVNHTNTITYTKKILDKNKKIVIKSIKTGTNLNNADVKNAHGALVNSSNLFSVATEANIHNISSSMSTTTDNNFLYEDVSTKNDKIQFKKADSAILKCHPKKKSFLKITEASYVNNNSPTLKCYKNNKSSLNGSVLLKYKDLVSSEMTKNIDLPEKERKQELPKVKLTNLDTNDDSKSVVDGINYTTKLETASEPLNVKSKTDKALNIVMKVNEMKNSKTIRDILNVTERSLTNDQCENINKNVILEDANELYIQTNEVDFIISGVQGGVELEATKIASYNCKTIQEDKKKSICDEIMEKVQKQKNTTNFNTLNVIKNEPNTNTSLNLKENRKLSMEISQSSFSIENSNMAENSGFGCIKLNNDLAANSKFNTNHEVPKLIAQQKDAKKIVEKSYFAKKKTKLNKYIDTPSIKYTSMVKPKTVAEKRRLLELAKRNELQITEKTKPKWKQPTNFKYVEVKKELLDPQKKSQLKITETPKANRKQSQSIKDGTDKKELKHARRAGYVLYTNRKIFVNSATPNKCVANINCIKRDAKSPTHRKKLSLLNQRYKRSKRLLYRPGPLSKKELLQLTGSNLWKTQLLKLPKITLEVFPQQGKRFCDTVLHRLNTIVGGEMDSAKIEFALSALKSKADNQSNSLQSIKFSLTYQNKVENILVRKKKFISQVEPINKRNSFSLTVDHKSVASVIEDLIKYVEIKEIASTLIKEDEIKVKDEIAPEAQLELPIENTLCNKRRKRTKVERELLRLNHKVVNVELKNDKEDVYIVCNKPYCKLGCICNSLKYDFLSDHCQKLACMFNCRCPKHKSFRYDELNLHSGTNLLSKDTVTRIEDEAKKHLAKVEREFTQTVIHTNDKTILIGVGDRAKSRRAAKVPAKFLDFVASEEKPENVLQKCYVSLEKLDLSEVIQLCLTHCMYNCQCEGLVIPEQKKKVN